MHIRLGRRCETIAIHGQTVHYVQVHHIAVHMADHGLVGFGHGLEKIILRRVDPAVLDLAGGVYPAFAIRRGDADGHILQRAAETAHRVPFEMRKHEEGIVIVNVHTDDVVRDMLVFRDRNLNFTAHIHDLDRGDVAVATLLEHIEAFLRGFAVAVVCGGAFHQRATDLLYEILDERRIEIIGFLGFTRMDLNGHLAFRRCAQRMVDGNQAVRRNDWREEDLRGLRVVGAVVQSFQSGDVDFGHNRPRFFILSLSA